MASAYTGPIGPHGAVRAFAQLLPAGARVVDLGAGDGRNSLYLAGLGHDVTAVDIRAEAVTEARAYATLYGVGLRHVAVQGDVTAPDAFADDGVFDGVVCTFVAQDLAPDDRRALIATIQRLTAPGGLALLAAYAGNPVQARVVRSSGLIAERETAMWFRNAGWTVVREIEKRGAMVAVNGRARPQWTEAVVIARRPAASATDHVPARAAAAEDPDARRSLLDRLRHDDPEAYEDATFYGVGPFADGAVG